MDWMLPIFVAIFVFGQVLIIGLVVHERNKTPEQAGKDMYLACRAHGMSKEEAFRYSLYAERKKANGGTITAADFEEIDARLARQAALMQAFR